MEIAGVVHNTTVNAVRGVCSERSETNAKRVTVVLLDGREVNVRSENRKRCDQIDSRQLVLASNPSAVALRGSEGAPE